MKFFVHFCEECLFFNAKTFKHIALLEFKKTKKIISPFYVTSHPRGIRVCLFKNINNKLIEKENMEV